MLRDDGKKVATRGRKTAPKVFAGQSARACISCQLGPLSKGEETELEEAQMEEGEEMEEEGNVEAPVVDVAESQVIATQVEIPATQNRDEEETQSQAAFWRLDSREDSQLLVPVHRSDGEETKEERPDTPTEIENTPPAKRIKTGTEKEEGQNEKSEDAQDEPELVEPKTDDVEPMELEESVHEEIKSDDDTQRGAFKVGTLKL